MMCEKEAKRLGYRKVSGEKGCCASDQGVHWRQGIHVRDVFCHGQLRHRACRRANRHVRCDVRRRSADGIPSSASAIHSRSPSPALRWTRILSGIGSSIDMP
ncbi:MAG: hypothetical protein MZV64_35655 [Ignavibacteriales bacterium]|nr:hypothetical protein [Ignavibacteriales bacterium]